YVFGRAVAHASLTGAAGVVAGAVPIAGGAGPEGVVESPGTAAPAQVPGAGGAGSAGASPGNQLLPAAASSGVPGQPTAIASTGRTSSARLSKGGASTASIYV